MILTFWLPRCVDYARTRLRSGLPVLHSWFGLRVDAFAHGYFSYALLDYIAPTLRTAVTPVGLLLRALTPDALRWLVWLYTTRLLRILHARTLFCRTVCSLLYCTVTLYALPDCTQHTRTRPRVPDWFTLDTLHDLFTLHSCYTPRTVCGYPRCWLPSWFTDYAYVTRTGWLRLPHLAVYAVIWLLRWTGWLRCTPFVGYAAVTLLVPVGYYTHWLLILYVACPRFTHARTRFDCTLRCVAFTRYTGLPRTDLILFPHARCV